MTDGLKESFTISPSLFMLQPFEEWWKGHIVLPGSIRIQDGVSSLQLSFSELAICVEVLQAGASMSFGHITRF